MGTKRIIINILLVICYLLLLSPLYLSIKPISIELELKQNEDDILPTIQLFYQKDFEKEFRNRHSEVKIVGVNGKVSFEIKAFYIHDLRLLISGDKGELIQISKLQSGEHNLLEIADIKTLACRQVTNDDNKNTFEIEHANYAMIDFLNLKLFPIYSLDFKLFFIILSLAFFINFKILNYCFQLTNRDKYSIINIIFVVICFVALFIPMLRISDEDISESEKRSLAKFKPFVIDGTINLNFGRDFDKFFSDRFLGREFIISTTNDIKRRISGKPRTSNIWGEDGWRFFNSPGVGAGCFDGYEFFQNKSQFTNEELKRIAEYLSEINDYCKKNNKRFYYVIHPVKSHVYGEFFNPDIIKIRPDSESRTMQLVNYLKQNSDVKVIYTLDTLLDAKKQDIVYYKTDTHWTKLGAYYGYLELAKELKKEFDFEILEPVAYEDSEMEFSGDLLLMGEKNAQTFKYKSPIFKYDDTLEISKAPNDIYALANNINNQSFNRNKKLKMVIYRDSFSSSWLQLFGNSCQKLNLLWRYRIVPEDEKMLKDADIIVMSQVERFTNELIQYTFPDFLE